MVGFLRMWDFYHSLQMKERIGMYTFLKYFKNHNYLNWYLFFYSIYSWFSLVDTLAKLHSVNYKAIGLGDYGKSSGFYSRQIRSLHKVSRIQATVVDENGNEVGSLLRLDEMIEWFKNNEISDETTILHGDFKV